MNKKDIICPFCLNQITFNNSEYNTYRYSIDLNESIANINLYDNNNNILNMNFDPEFMNNEIEPNIISSNSVYNINNFHFSKINKKDSTSNSNIIKEEIKNDLNSNKPQEKLGRKCKRNKYINPKDKKVHDKFTPDNLRKKVKNLVLKNLLEFINNKIKSMYNNIGHGNSEKKLFCLKAQKIDTYNLYFDFMNKNLKDIFSQEISEKCSNHPKDHNKNIIDSLINDKDEKNYFTKLFGLTFDDCLKNFRGDKYIKELEGFKDFSFVKEQLLIENGEEYVNCLEEKMKNLEELICKKVKKDGKNFQEAFNK